jgi:hypothetical protein
MKVTLRLIDWHALRKQQRRWQLANFGSFLRRWRASTREIVL